MTSFGFLAEILTSTLELTRRPVAVTFCVEPPDNVPRLVGAQPSGCSFWSLAAEGQVFCTVAQDHYNCPIGSHTHNIPLPPDREGELPQVLSVMTERGYLRMEEVPSIPRLTSTPGAVVYAPLANAPVPPDVVVLTGRPGGLMLLHETASRAGIDLQPMLGRPTCMALPTALASSAVTSSFGCIGNRIYTALSRDELYSVIPGQSLESLVSHLAAIQSANAALAEYHQGRLALRST